MMEEKGDKKEYAYFIEDLDALGQLLARELGLTYAQTKRDDLWRTLKEMALSRKEEPKDLLLSLLSKPMEKEDRERLIPPMTVNETYFFREIKSLEAFQDAIIQEKMKSSRGRDSFLRMWSAGCSSGEEPYSLAILLHQNQTSRYFDYNILATDVNPLALERAKEGVYREWSFRTLDPDIREEYFEKNSEKLYTIKPKMKERVSFSYLNLAQDSYPSLLNGIYDLDVIFCRNVLIYFKPSVIERVIHGFYRSLKEGGWLIVSPVEVSLLHSSPFTPITLSETTIFTKKRRDLQNPTIFSSVEDEKRISYNKRKEDREELLLKVVPQQEIKDLFIEAQLAYEKKEYKRALHLLYKYFEVHGYGKDEEDEENSPLLLIAHILAHSGQLKEALLYCERALPYHRESSSLFFLKGTIYQELGKRDSAIKALKRSLYLDPSSAPVYYILGTLAIEEGDNREARRYFHNAKALLSSLPKESIIEELDGMTAGRLLETIPPLLKEVD